MPPVAVFSISMPSTRSAPPFGRARLVAVSGSQTCSSEARVWPLSVRPAELSNWVMVAVTSLPCSGTISMLSSLR